VAPLIIGFSTAHPARAVNLPFGENAVVPVARPADQIVFSAYPAEDTHLALDMPLPLIAVVALASFHNISLPIVSGRPQEAGEGVPTGILSWEGQ